MLWFRGIPSLEQVAAPIPSDTMVSSEAGDADCFNDSKLVIFTDGSGGKHASEQALRRTAWAWAVLDAHFTDLRSVQYGTLAGSRQTVPRAELTAILQCL